MDKQHKGNQQTEREIKFYWAGLIVLAGLWSLSFIFGSLFSPLKLLQLRLSINGIAAVYFLSIYLLHRQYSKKTHEKHEANNDIIIWFNGRELERK